MCHRCARANFNHPKAVIEFHVEFNSAGRIATNSFQRRIIKQNAAERFQLMRIEIIIGDSDKIKIRIRHNNDERITVFREAKRTHYRIYFR